MMAHSSMLTHQSSIYNFRTTVDEDLSSLKNESVPEEVLLQVDSILKDSVGHRNKSGLTFPDVQVRLWLAATFAKQDKVSNQ